MALEKGIDKLVQDLSRRTTFSRKQSIDDRRADMSPAQRRPEKTASRLKRLFLRI
jgi:hypothetical protein